MSIDVQLRQFVETAAIECECAVPMGVNTSQLVVRNPFLAPTSHRKVAIIGYAPTVRAAPWNDNAWCIWGLNDQLVTMPRVDVLFEIHDPSVVKLEGHWAKLAAFVGPIFMQETHADVPTSRRFPLAEIAVRHMIPGTDRPYLTCSASLMLAFAINMEPMPEEIALYGVEMLMNEEFRAQRPSCEFWLGVAHGRGIKITMQPESSLLKTAFVYGWSDAVVAVQKAQMNERRIWLESQLNNAINKEAEAKEERLQYAGALSDHTYHAERLMI